MAELGLDLVCFRSLVWRLRARNRLKIGLSYEISGSREVPWIPRALSLSHFLSQKFGWTEKSQSHAEALAGLGLGEISIQGHESSWSIVQIGAQGKCDDGKICIFWAATGRVGEIRRGRWLGIQWISVFELSSEWMSSKGCSMMGNLNTEGEVLAMWQVEAGAQWVR